MLAGGALVADDENATTLAAVLRVGSHCGWFDSDEVRYVVGVLACLLPLCLQDFSFLPLF